MVPRPLKRPMKDLTRMVTDLFNLPETSRQVLKALYSCRDALSVKEIVARVKRSERGVRAALSHLVSKGLLLRKVSITGSKRLAYRYTLGPIERLVKVARLEILNRLERLERLEGRLSSAKGARAQKT